MNSCNSTMSAWALVSFIVLPAMNLNAQQAGSSPPATQASAKLSQEELDQLLAPIALYPDALISQILMAATYPLEIVQAERWAKQNSQLTGDALTDALEQQPWDPSVKSLVNVQQVLSMMSEKLDWTTKLGDAFLSQQKEVLDSMQRLRAKAKDQGNLVSSSEQTVKVEPAGNAANATYITIESSSPDVVYVPTYDPVVVYGTWPYPSYPPYYYYPPGYVARPGVWWGAGFACGAAWGYAWGNCNWNHGDIDIDMNRNTFVNNRIDRSRYQNNNSFQGNKGRWQHNPSHRQGTPYRDQQLARKYNKPSTTDAARSRDAYRGRADAGRQDLARSGPGQLDRTPGANRGPNQTGGPSDRAGPAADRSAPQDRSNRTPAAGQNRPSSGNRPAGNSNRGGAFGDGQSGQAARQQSQRGQSSRSQASRPSSGGGGRSAPARGGGARAGGGGGGRRR